MAGLIKELAAQFFKREIESGALVTVTHADASPDLKNASIYITVLPEDKEEETLNQIERSTSELKRYLGEHMKTKFIPAIHVKIDKGEKARQRIEELSREI